jgi:hypothetical protein
VRERASKRERVRVRESVCACVCEREIGGARMSEKESMWWWERPERE